MKTAWIHSGIASAALLISGAFAPAALASGLIDETYPVLQTRTGTYTNVTVTTRAEKYIFIFHANGMSSVRVSDLSDEVRRELGYAPPVSQVAQKTNRIVSVAAREFNQVNRNLLPLERDWKERLQRHRKIVKLSSEGLMTAIAILAALYLFLSYCGHLICLKSKSPGGVLVWVPGLQILPLFRAAGMSGWWCLACLVPLLNIAAIILWSLKIVRARGKSVVWAILLMLPVTNLIAFLYLAFSSSSADETPSAKFQTRSLQTA